MGSNQKRHSGHQRPDGTGSAGSPNLNADLGRGLASPPASVNGYLEAKFSFLFPLLLLLHGDANFSQSQSQPELLKMD